MLPDGDLLPHLICFPSVFSGGGVGMRRVSMATRDELVVVLRERYARSCRAERGRILNEFAAVTGFHRKHAMRLLRGGQANQQRGPRLPRWIHDDAVHEALILVWEASDRTCGKRLRPLV